MRAWSGRWGGFTRPVRRGERSQGSAPAGGRAAARGPWAPERGPGGGAHGARRARDECVQGWRLSLIFLSEPSPSGASCVCPEDSPAAAPPGPPGGVPVCLRHLSHQRLPPALPRPGRTLSPALKGTPPGGPPPLGLTPDAPEAADPVPVSHLLTLMMRVFTGGCCPH